MHRRHRQRRHQQLMKRKRIRVREVPQQCEHCVFAERCKRLIRQELAQTIGMLLAARQFRPCHRLVSLAHKFRPLAQRELLSTDTDPGDRCLRRRAATELVKCRRRAWRGEAVGNALQAGGSAEALAEPSNVDIPCAMCCRWTAKSITFCNDGTSVRPSAALKPSRPMAAWASPRMATKRVPGATA